MMSDQPRKRAKKRGMKPSVPPYDTPEDIARNQGATAFWDDMELDENPYSESHDPELWGEWRHGWHKAQHEVCGDIATD